jgi:hypothetical protein
VRYLTIVAAIVAAGCRAPVAPGAIDPAMAARVPPSAIALAGVNLDELRGSPLYGKLPAPAAAFLESFRGAHSVLIASTGAELLTIARGTVPGGTQAAPDLALLGSPALIAAGAAPHAPPAVLVSGESVAADHSIWIAIRGGAPLPLTGNLANANNLIILAESVTLTARVDDAVDLELIARCPTPDAALHFEQRVRALASLSNLRGLQLRRDDRTVRAALSASPGDLGRWIVP